MSSNNICLGSTLSFSNTSSYATGVITTWNWDFGNGNTSNIQNPSYSYTASGIYTITLLSSSASGCSGSSIKVVTVNINPSVQFSGDVLSGCTTQTVNFLSTSSPSISSQYSWNFGDGQTSAVQNPSHIYTTDGSYTVKLFVTTSNGCKDSLIKSSYITIYNSPSASFSSFGKCINSVTSFTNSSTGSITSWNWNFGDGNSSTAQNPTHVYSSSGSYSVSLIVSNAFGCSGAITNSVIINNKPIVQFIADSLIGCAPTVINFTNQSTPLSGLSFIWQFGDNTISNLLNPSHSYTTSGLYSVKLKASESGGCSDSLEKLSYISILNSPVALYSLSNSTVNLPNAVVSFSNTSSNYINVNWFLVTAKLVFKIIQVIILLI